MRRLLANAMNLFENPVVVFVLLVISVINIITGDRGPVHWWVFGFWFASWISLIGGRSREESDDRG